MIIDAELTICPAFGWQVEPQLNTLIKANRGGHERRRPLWTSVRHRFLLPFNNITDEAFRLDLKSVFLCAMGSAHAFFVKDESDYKADGAVFGVGDGTETEFDLVIQSTFGSASYTRQILYPVDAIYMVDGVPAAATFNTATKKVEFDTSPDDGAVLTWTGEFRILVRFASDTFPMSIDTRRGQSYAMNGTIELMEVWE